MNTNPFAAPLRASLATLLCALLAGPAWAQAPAAEAKPELAVPANPVPAAAPASPTAPGAPAAAKPEDSMPEDCTKLIGAIVACRTAGGWKQTICEKGAAMQFSKCPIPVDKLPIKL